MEFLVPEGGGQGCVGAAGGLVCVGLLGALMASLLHPGVTWHTLSLPVELLAAFLRGDCVCLWQAVGRRWMVLPPCLRAGIVPAQLSTWRERNLALEGTKRAGDDAVGSGRSTCLLPTSQRGASSKRRFDKAASHGEQRTLPSLWREGNLVSRVSRECKLL